MEVLVALVIGIMVVSAVMSSAVTTLRTVDANRVREKVHRNARYLGMSLERDFQRTGVGIKSTPSFGTLVVQGDTIAILSVEFDATLAPPYDLDPPPGTDNPLPPGGTCGARCLDLVTPSGPRVFAAGDLARLQVHGTRRLILIESVSGSKKIRFTAHTQLLGNEAGLSGGLLLDRFGTFVQKLSPVIYYLEGDRLMRATMLYSDGTPVGSVIAFGIKSFNVSLVFADGDEAAEANSTDADPTNDFDDILGIRIQADVTAGEPTTRGGSEFVRSYEWRFSPRNLKYERNTI
jgi:hypothetical protein